jgi:hypothetical protein
MSQAWWCMPIIPALRQKDSDFEVSVGYIVKPCLEQQQKNPKKKQNPIQNKDEMN